METALPSEILPEFYKTNNLPAEGGKADASVRIQLAKHFVFYFPNFDAHRVAVIRHDVHHLVTGYSASTLAGESEISAWEIASGCKKYWVAFLINTSCFMIGVPFNLPNLLKAYARGRRTKNLYQNEIPEETFLHTPIFELKKKLLLDRFPMDTKVNVWDVASFTLFLLFASVYFLFTLPGVPLIALYSLYVVLSAKE